MKFTKNYHLPQWVEDDLILMDDFNKMNENLEAGMNSNASAAEEAKKAAENARVTAVGALNTAESALSAKPYVVGSYVGNGERQHIELGFRPSFVIISGMYSVNGANNVSDYVRYFAISGGNVLRDRVSFDNTGFTVIPSAEQIPSSIYYRYPEVAATRTYDYIAFK